MAKSTFDISNLWATKMPVAKQKVPNLNYVSGELGADKTEVTPFGTPMILPLKIKKMSDPDTDKGWFLLPIEPMVTIGGSNVLVKRNVAKMPLNRPNRLRGTIKERWTEDDLTISIDGVFINADLWLSFTDAEVKRFYDIITSGEPIEIQHKVLLDVFNVKFIVVESFDFPFTKGKENQTYSIKAVSDDEWDLFIKLEGKEDVA